MIREQTHRMAMAGLAPAPKIPIVSQLTDSTAPSGDDPMPTHEVLAHVDEYLSIGME